MTIIKCYNYQNKNNDSDNDEIMKIILIHIYIIINYQGFQSSGSLSDRPWFASSKLF